MCVQAQAVLSPPTDLRQRYAYGPHADPGVEAGAADLGAVGPDEHGRRRDVAGVAGVEAELQVAADGGVHGEALVEERLFALVVVLVDLVMGRDVGVGEW